MTERGNGMLDPKRIIKVALASAGCVFAIFYMYRQLIGLRGEKLETENALNVTYERTVSSTGYILRSERLLETVSGGAVFSVLDDGERIGSGMPVANVYATEAEAGSKARLDIIDSKLDVLESSTVDHEYFSANLSKLERDKNEVLKSVIKYKTENDFGEALLKKRELLIKMNKLSTVKSGSSFDEQIEELRDERSRLTVGQGEPVLTIYAPEAGYYSGILDGYENIFSSGIIDTLTISEFEELKKALPEKQPENSVGKIITDSRWYVMCELLKEETIPFENGKYYEIVFPYSANLSIRMQLHKTISETDKNTEILIFTTDEMPEGFSYTRSQKIEIVSEVYKGLKVPKVAMRRLEDKFDGVYILIGETVYFRRAEPVFEIDDYYIIRTESEQETSQTAAAQAVSDNTQTTEQETQKNYKYLSLYDNVIVAGKELYDGKRIK